MSAIRTRRMAQVGLTLAAIVTATAAYGVDGVVLIDQNKALSGGVTPNDTPGFPVTISQSGSYRLSGNLTVPNENTHGIDISAADVTIDLNGFSIRGPVTCTGTPVTSCAPLGSGVGINASGGHSNITVYNGSVRGMGAAGIFLLGSGNLVETMRVESNGNFGIVINSGTVSRNTATRNSSSGMFVENGTTSHNTATGNRGHGIQGVSGAVSNNTASGNAVSGIDMRGGTINYNTAANNGNVGIVLGAKAGYTGNASNNNGGGAITGGVSLGGGNQNLCDGTPC